MIVLSVQAQVSVISDSTNKVLGILNVVKANLVGITYDDAMSEVFVANVADGTVSVISDSYLPSHNSKSNGICFPKSNCSRVWQCRSHFSDGSSGDCDPMCGCIDSQKMRPELALIG